MRDGTAAGCRAGQGGVVWEDDTQEEGPGDGGQAWIGGGRDGQTEQIKALDEDSGS